MKPYSKYKEMSLPWLKVIPAHWKIQRNKNVFRELREKVGEKANEYTLLSLTLKGVIPRNMEDGGKFPESFGTYKIIHRNNMVFCLFDMDETPRTVGLSQYEGMLTGAYTIMGVQNIKPEYLYYYYLALDNYKMLKPLYTGLRKTISINTFQSMKIPVPPRQEQDQIVRFLGWKVSEINRLIKIKKQEIAGLNDLKKTTINKAVTQGINDNISLRDSGVSWIGKIPYKWNIVKLGKCTRSISDIDHYMPNSVDDGFPYVMTGDLKPKVSQIDLNKCKMISEAEFRRLSKKSKAEKGDLIFARYATIGTVSYVDVDVDFLTSYSCVVIKIERQLLGEFLFYYMQSSSFFEDINQYIKINTQGNMGKAALQMVKIPLPPFSEQQEIVDYLDKNIEKIERLSVIKGKEVNVMQEYKTRLIFDVVTGQMDIRDIVVPEYEYVEEDLDDEPDSADESEEPTAKEVS